MLQETSGLVITEDTMFDRIIDGFLDFVFMVMILILSILGTLVVGI
ncbi:MAG: hypothetical protein OER74_09530 [Desulfobacteraceae bacterium]|nr:hypothetical protein [Desulfobacteraceae bacterium]